jgi:hypothetical protein
MVFRTINLNFSSLLAKLAKCLQKYFEKEEKQLYLQSQKSRELSSAGSEHLPYKQRVTGSNPVAPTESLTEMWGFSI